MRSGGKILLITCVMLFGLLRRVQDVERFDRQ
jgi:hypothetical protein